MLGVMKTQIEAHMFTSATSSCSAEGYSHTVPDPYALNTTTRTTVETTTLSGSAFPSTVTCVGESVAVGEGDTCESIAKEYSVSAYDFLSLNHLDIYCSDIAPSASLGLPEKCDIYTMGHGDTCYDIAEAYAISVVQLTSWNGILEGCINMKRWANWTICVRYVSSTIVSAGRRPFHR